MLNTTLSGGATGVLEDVLRRRSTTAPGTTVQGTALPFAGSAAAAAAAPLAVRAAVIANADVVADLPGSPSRGAPV